MDLCVSCSGNRNAATIGLSAGNKSASPARRSSPGSSFPPGNSQPARQVFARRPLGDQHTPRPVDHRSGDHVNERAGNIPAQRLTGFNRAPAATKTAVALER
jgi:hypothetical protein